MNQQPYEPGRPMERPQSQPPQQFQPPRPISSSRGVRPPGPPSSQMGSPPQRPNQSPEGESSGMFGSFLTVCLGAILIGTPLVFFNITFQGLQFEKYVYFVFWFILALLAWLFGGLVSGKLAVRKTPVWWFLLGAFGTLVLSASFSIDRFHSFYGEFRDPFNGVVPVLLLLLFFVVLFSHLNSSRLVLFRRLLIGSGVLAALWILPVLFGWYSPPQGFPFSTTGTLTTLSLFFVALLPLIVTSFPGERMKNAVSSAMGGLLPILLLGAFFIVMMTLWIVDEVTFKLWSGPFFAIITVGAILVFFSLSRVLELSKTWKIIPIVVFSLVLLFLFIGPNNVQRVVYPIEAAPTLGLSSETAFSSIANRPFLGYGPTTYDEAFALNKPLRFNEDRLFALTFPQGTGAVMESLATIGVLGTFVWFGVGAFFTILLYWMLFKIPDPTVRNRAVGFVVAFSALLIGSLFSPNNGVIAIMLVALGALALFSVMDGTGRSRAFFNLSLKRGQGGAVALSSVVFVVASVMVIGLVSQFYRVVVSDIQLKTAADQLNGSPEEAVRTGERAVALYGTEAQSHVFLSNMYIYLGAQEQTRGDERDLSLAETHYIFARDHAREAERLAPNSPIVMDSVARVFETLSSLDTELLSEARGKYERLTELAPTNPRYHVKLGQSYLTERAIIEDEGEKDRLEELAKIETEKAIEKKLNYAPAYFQLSLVDEFQEDTNQAISNVMSAAFLDQRNASYMFTWARLLLERDQGDDLENAEKILNYVVGLNDTNVNAHINLGLLLERTGRPDEAVEAFKQALDAVPAEQTLARQRVQGFIDNVRREPVPVAPDVPTLPEEGAVAGEETEAEFEEVIVEELSPEDVEG